MLILAFETSAKAASVALLEPPRLLGEVYQNTGLTHSQTLLVMAENLLKQCGKTAQDVTAVAAAHGPGSFTGVRIGAAAAKGFSWGRDIPCYGVSTLEAMAEGLGVWDGYVCPVMDARRSQVYNALFRAERGTLTRLTPDRALSLTELGEEIKNLEKPVFLVGDGAVLCYNTLSKDIPALVLPPEHRMHQRAVGVAILAARQAAAGLAPSGGELTPNYLRLSQAERERLEKQKAESSQL
ncbi:MAG: tRNA (adenosine(37)-N6)-threonylcarbamoyltransferase complex dimerization subunit type 1 TsaB [Candidatus Faecousia sp.]|nr:tRNA (adenosine(37)-N6)-threonylcarbamoyltransferase complex dimerization subunit type 1 TsaB [Bacillota bacterium]MDY6040872.1 tRNA (adenosine(37)-N6)-threonylcarbamoyltransferase complex dimerization subunit type 1 TsaB [Candidatus Faecousia sp.]